MTGVIVLLPEKEFYIVFIHSHETGIDEEKHKVCIHFSGSNTEKNSVFRLSNTMVVLVEYLPQNQCE